MRAGFGLTGLAQHLLAFGTMWERSGFLAEAFGFFSKALFKRKGLLETPATLHGNTSCRYGS
jgi:hypothetical protein